MRSNAFFYIKRTSEDVIYLKTLIFMLLKYIKAANKLLVSEKQREVGNKEVKIHVL